jgi:phytoene dehydrogenase-like protein
MKSYDAVVVGAGPNGLAAAIVLARAGQRVLLLEANERVGGALSSAALTLPGFVHDLGSAVHPLGVGSPFFRSLPLERFGLRWLHPPLPFAHPLDGGRAVVIQRSIRATAAGLGRDATAYWQLMAPVVRQWEKIAPTVLGPLRPPRHLLAVVAFGLRAIWSADGLARSVFREEPARALFAGIAAHSCLPLEQAPSAAVGLVLGTLAHQIGWPIPQGGAQRFAEALAGYLRSLGGEIRTNQAVSDLGDLPTTNAVLLNLAPQQVLKLVGDRLPAGYRRGLQRYRSGPGVFKVDWALDGPIPWSAPTAQQAGTLHLSGTLAETADAERAPWHGQIHDRPYVLLAQPSNFDASRAPAGKQSVWAYCHVPNGCSADATAQIEAQIERFAPGFCNRILARSIMGPAALEAWNANLVGGDVTGGISDFGQLFTRPVVSANPYRIPVPGLFLCSSATPPGPGVHGLCGMYAANTALHDLQTGIRFGR